MDEILRTKWYLHESREARVGHLGALHYQYDYYISTHPEPGKGYRIINPQLWSSAASDYTGWVERGLLNYIVMLHNSVYEMEYRPFEDAPPPPEKPKYIPAHRPPPWPKGVSRKNPDGSRRSFEEAQKIAQSNSKGLEEPKVPVKTSEFKENIQPEKRQSHVLSTAALAGETDQGPINYVSSITKQE